MRDLSVDNITDAVIGSIAGTEDPRLKELLSVFIRKAHEAVRETKLQQDEWTGLVEFLRRTGDISDAHRNEFIIMSDILGISSLMDLMNAAQAPASTTSSLLGPFFVPDTPMLPVDGDLIKDNEGDRIVVQGRVLSSNGGPLPGALLEFWQNAANGLYSNMDPGQHDDNLRCRMLSDDTGCYSLSTIRPVSYEVPDDGTGGEFVRATGRHCWRPAHLHVRVQSDRHNDLVTEIFDMQDDYLDQDAVFGVRTALALPFTREPTAEEQSRYAGVAAPYTMVDFDFVLQPVDP